LVTSVSAIEGGEYPGDIGNMPDSAGDNGASKGSEGMWKLSVGNRSIEKRERLGEVERVAK
jgi:hypothetical protein